MMLLKIALLVITKRRLIVRILYKYTKTCEKENFQGEF